jgi:hypothetical protein
MKNAYNSNKYKMCSLNKYNDVVVYRELNTILNI